MPDGPSQGEDPQAGSGSAIAYRNMSGFACQESAAMRFIARLFILAAIIAPGVGNGATLETYGKLPALEDVSISPDGTRLAFVRAVKNDRIIAVRSIADRKMLGMVRVGEETLRSIEWADNDDLLVETSKTRFPIPGRGNGAELVQLMVLRVSTGRVQALPELGRLNGERGISNIVAGRVLCRQIDGHTNLFIRGVQSDARRSWPILIQIDLATTRERVVGVGAPGIGQEWLVDSDGRVVATSTYDDAHQTWNLRIHHGDEWQTVATRTESVDLPGLVGFGPQAGTAILEALEDKRRVWRAVNLADGSLGPPMAEGKVLQFPMEDRRSHRMIGGEYIDDETRYVFFDGKVQSLWNAIVSVFAGARLRLVSASEDLSKLVVRVDGGGFGFQYELVDLNTLAVKPIGEVYEGIAQPLTVRRITYPASDGLQIPGYLTLPNDRAPSALPLVVLPHGGPAARDTADFDWWSQALANEGYAVLRPNYRGSTVSQRFREAGYGEFGRKMQTDLSDGVNYLVREGIVDPSRVCIAGASYGGYAALAGVSLDPKPYRCAVSVAGISDLKLFLASVNANKLHDDNITMRYLDRFLGVTGPDDANLEKISPIRHIDAVNVPVLLVHGRNDTVVPIEQSERIFEAMQEAGKNVRLVKLEGEDHWLSRDETRLEMLKATVEFLRKYNPPD
jgi:dipeptidyl aminopeptidase/acylaminoacyl peptidase